ncbi:MAG TPA: amino acid permease [Rhodanobacteraceae bacterium]|nr:amino acid permease [Rhodanobacteraceae bacterium]
MWKQLLATKPVAPAAIEANNELKRTLGPWALIALGIGAIIGTGIFVLTGVAAAENAGPALVLSFILAGTVCGLSALCYAEFSAMIPESGSAYSYSYATLGEFIAWFIGWNLVLEYLVSMSAVAVGWSGYVVPFLRHLGITLPAELTTSPLTQGVGSFSITTTGALVNLPAIFVCLALTAVCYVGIRQSSMANIVIVIIKLLVIFLFIGFGVHYIAPDNWHPFIPDRICDTAAAVTAQCKPGHFGWFGIVEGASIIFFAYIGFDAVSTAAQEARNPQRDMPIGIIVSLIVCTILYIIVALVLTGMVPFAQLNVPHPVGYAVEQVPALKTWLAPLIELGALAGLSSVMLVMMIAQPRIFYSMSKDGLLPKVFAKVHPKYRTPHINTVITGVIAAVLAGFLPIDILAELTNIGTLLAFMTVCIAVPILRRTRPDLPRPFRTPWAPVTATLGAAGCLYLIYGLPLDTWVRLIIWTAVGVAIYFGYGYRHSRLRAQR